MTVDVHTSLSPADRPSVRARPLPYRIESVATVVGKIISAEEWAARVRIPNRKLPGKLLGGSEVTRITGVESKCWDPERFAGFAPVVEASQLAMARAGARPDEIDLVIVLTATPYLPQLSADGFELLRLLGLPDEAAPIQLHVGCAAMARAMQLVSQTSARRPLIIAYEVSSPYMESRLYYENDAHPRRDTLWMSPALFSDGAGAMVLRRDEAARGAVVYSRDASGFGDEPGFHDPLIEYAGGGALRAPGTPGAEALSVYAMNGEATRRYYGKGMMLNHAALEAVAPGYLRAVRRVYMHQASPRLVEQVREQLVREAGARPEQLPHNAHLVGNLVAPATLKLLDDDVAAGAVGAGDELCFSVVGAGPERGGFLIAMAGA
jgi:3-oxoacyl-[acyl-carrier-protein] synthase-3